MATTATPTHTHITVQNAGDNKPEDRWHTDETYKVTQKVADELAHMKKKPTGRDLASWLEARGGVLDDGNGHAARVERKNDGTILNDHYKDGKYTGDDIVEPSAKAAKDRKDVENGVTLFMTLITGGAYPLIKAVGDAQAEADGHGSRFTSTAPATQPAPAADSGSAPAVAAKSTPAAKAPKPTP